MSQGALEAFIKITTGILIELSEKSLIDCCDYSARHLREPDPCKRANDIHTAMTYLKRKGIATEKKYPTKPVGGECNEFIDRIKVAFRKVMLIDGGEEEMKKALYLYGPLIAHIYFDEWFGYYKDGIFYEPNILLGKIKTHYVLIVGFGVDLKTGLPYWIIKNSWGPVWGDGGYMKMARGVNQNNITNLVYAIA